MKKRARHLGVLAVVSLVAAGSAAAAPGKVQVGGTVHHDVSPPLREMRQLLVRPQVDREANPNPRVPNNHKDSPDTVVQGPASTLGPQIELAAPLTSFDGIAYPGVGCNCAPPDSATMTAGRPTGNVRGPTARSAPTASPKRPVSAGTGMHPRKF